MRIFNKFRGTKGFISMWERVIRFRYMITEQAKERVRILAFWEKYGDAAVQEAFRVSRPTLYRWQRALRAGYGKLEALNKGSTAPKHRRKRIVPDALRDAILRERCFDPRLGKEKLAVLLKEDGIATLSASTVGRMLADLKKRGALPDYRTLSFNGRTGEHYERRVYRRRKLRSRGHAGGLVKADTVVRFHNGVKRYILTAIDTQTKFAFAYAFPSHTSATAAEFLRLFKSVAPLSLTHVQTDNGSEFAAHFELLLATEGIVHFHTYPRSPKMNAEVERFNRTLSEAFICYHRHLLAYDINTFNKKLIDWLLWYNTRRPHWSLGLVSPLRYIVSQLSAVEYQKCWTNTED
jgi:transposase InsO family protein